MKNITIVVITLFISISSFAQHGINYKALIKDDLGNVIANQGVTIQFTILDALSGGNIETQEIHYSIMSDANGIVIVNIGEGFQSLSYGFFNDIDWGSHAYYLQVGIDITGGTNFEDMGTTQFMSVPYAKHAESASIAENVSGLEKVIEYDGSQDNTGWRIKDVDNNNYGVIGQWAVDLSRQQQESDIRGATDFASFAAGLNTEASGPYSIAMGDNTIASGFASTAFGQYNVDNPLTIFSIGNGSFSQGRSNALTLTANDDFIIGNSQIDDDPNDINDNTKFFFSGQRGALRAGRVSVQFGDEWNIDNIGLYSAAFGTATKASGNYSTAIGSNTIASTTASFASGIANADDPNAIFMVGNGTTPFSAEPIRNNAFVVKYNGDIVVDGEIQQTNTGNANMIPIAYGTVESNANVLSGTGNFSATISSGVITITVDNENLTVFNSACTIVPYGGNPRFSTLTYLNNKLEVRVFNSSGSITPTTFQFVLYKL